MTPQEKAKELVGRFILVNSESVELVTGEYELLFSLTQEDAKQCALIAVDEILNNFGTLTEGKQHYAAHCTIKFYEEVKQEIELI